MASNTTIPGETSTVYSFSSPPWLSPRNTLNFICGMVIPLGLRRFSRHQCLHLVRHFRQRGRLYLHRAIGLEGDAVVDLAVFWAGLGEVQAAVGAAALLAQQSRAGDG